MKISEDVQNILNAAYADAKDRGSEYITPEHVMYAAVFFESVETILGLCGVEPAVIKEELSEIKNLTAFAISFTFPNLPNG